MSIQSKCQTCGRKIPTAGGKLSSIEFRRIINDINTLDKLISSKKYIGKFVYSKFRLIKYADNFLEKLEEEIQYIDPIATTIHEDLNRIRIWILNYIDQTEPDPKGALLGNDLESPVYQFLHSVYSEIDEPFHDFYNNYASNVDNSLSKNHVSRALTALGLKPAVKKIKHNDKPKCVMFICATKEELADIFRKNGY